MDMIMKTHITLILFLVLTNTTIQAQNRRQDNFIELFCTKPLAIQKAGKIILQPHSYDVIYYDIFLDWYNVLNNTNRNYKGNVLIRAKVDTANSINQIKLDCGISVDSVRQNDFPVTFTLSSNVLTVNLNRSYYKGEIFEIKIYFQRNRNDNLGFYYYSQSEQTFENLAYTMAEPSDARYWFPCYDDPSDKADSIRVTVKVPNGFTATSNGLLKSKTSNGDTTTFVWFENHPITTYLIAVTSSKYSNYVQTYNSIHPPNELFEIQHYFWQADSAQGVYVARNLSQMMQCFETFYGKYPFGKYGHVYVRPFQYGGMEHQTISTLHRNWITNDSQNGIAHELAHMWWGDLITCETWKDIWLNEGFATFSEDLYTEYRYGKDAYFASMSGRANFYYSYNPGYAIYNPGYIFNTAISYYKGALVLNMMRYVLDDSLFFTALMNYKNQHLYSTATTESFKNSVSNTIGFDFSYFINQWIYQPNHPKYSYNWNVVNNQDGTYSLNVILKQTQTHYPVYKMPFEIKVNFEVGDTLIRVLNENSFQSYSFIFSKSPINITLDPNNYILKEIQRDITLDTGDEFSVKNFYLYQNFPNPFNSQTTIRFNLGEKGNTTLKIFNLVGQEIETLLDAELDKGEYQINWTISNIPSGMYLYRLTSGNYWGMKKLALLK